MPEAKRGTEDFRCAANIPAPDVRFQSSMTFNEPVEKATNGTVIGRVSSHRSRTIVSNGLPVRSRS